MEGGGEDRAEKDEPARPRRGKPTFRSAEVYRMREAPDDFLLQFDTFDPSPF